MAVDGIRSLYIETHDFGKAARFWMGLGFAHFLELGGKSGGFRAADGGTYLFLEEVGPDAPLAVEPYFNAVGEGLPAGIDVVTPWEDTHWGTRLAEVSDPDGRTWKLEATDQTFPDYG